MVAEVVTSSDAKVIALMILVLTGVMWIAVWVLVGALREIRDEIRALSPEPYEGA